MKKLVFYPISQEYTERDGFIQIILTDNEETLGHNKCAGIIRKIDFFTDHIDLCTEIIYDLKGIEEEMCFKADPEIHLCDEAQLKECISKALGEGKLYRILYYEKGEVIKEVSLTQGETLEIFVKPELLSIVEDVLGRYAVKESYEKWELGE